MRSSILLLFFLCAAVLATPAGASVNQTASYPAPLVSAPPPLDLSFSAIAWEQALAVSGFQTITTRSVSKYATVAHIVMDKDAIYVGIHSEQSGVPLTATQTTNNLGFGLDDFAGIGIDTSGNGQNVYFFETTPAAVRYQQSSESARFNPVWKAVAKADGAGGWDAELVVPLNVLRTSSVRNWRFNIVRHIAVLSENETWAYDPLMMSDSANPGWPFFGDARFWPELTGVPVTGRAARPKPRAEIFALGSIGRDRGLYAQSDGSFQNLQGTRSGGLDVNVPLTGTISFVGALAPDFSNVEVDQQTIAPQEFRRGLAEYRPFFAQGANYFTPAFQNGINQFPNQIFYSPNIGPFDRGGKIEGTRGFQSLGLLNVQGAGFNDTVVAIKHSIPNKQFGWSFDAVSAHHRDGSATNYPFDSSDVTYDLRVAGRNNATGFVYGLAYAGEQGSTIGKFAGLAHSSDSFVDVHRQNYEVFLAYKDLGPKYNPIDGFTNLQDIRGPQMFFDLNGNPPARSILKRADLFVTMDRFVDRSGGAHQADASANLDLIFKNLLHLSGGPSTSSVKVYDFNGVNFVGYDAGYRGGVTIPFNQHSFNIGYKDGTATPYDVGFSWGPFTTFHSDGTLRPTYLRQYNLGTSRPLGSRFSVGLEYDGTLETFATSDPNVRTHDGQILRRISFGRSFGPDSNLSLALRSISGRGGFGVPGVNLAASFHRRFRSDNELFINYGTPAATSTLQRLIVKYLVRLGSGAGT